MKTNSRIIETKTYVNKDKRSVTVVQKYELDVFALKGFVEVASACKEIDKYVQSMIGRGNNKFNFENHKLTFIVSGKSKCQPTDEFNETVGFRIADTRAQAKAMNFFSKFYYGLREIIYNNLLSDIDDKCDNCANAYWKCINHEEKLVENS